MPYWLNLLFPALLCSALLYRLPPFGFCPIGIFAAPISWRAFLSVRARAPYLELICSSKVSRFSLSSRLPRHYLSTEPALRRSGDSGGLQELKRRVTKLKNKQAANLIQYQILGLMYFFSHGFIGRGTTASRKPWAGNSKMALLLLYNMSVLVWWIGGDCHPFLRNTL